MADTAVRETADMIVPWAQVRKDDQVLLDGTLTPVTRTEAADDVGPLGSPVTVARVTFQRGVSTWTEVHAASLLTAVRRPVTCALCGARLARTGSGPWVRSDDPGRGEPLCAAGDSGDEAQAHEPTLLDVPSYAALRLALADLADARAAYLAAAGSNPDSHPGASPEKGGQQ